MDKIERVYFLPHPSKPESIVGRLTDGEVVYVDRQARKIPLSGETWDCIIIENKGGRFAVPQSKAADAGRLAGPLSTFDGFLKTSEGTEFWRHVENTVERRADDKVFELAAEIKRKGDTASRRVEALELRLAGIEKDLGDEEDWTDSEIIARILHQLDRKGCWGGKHTSEKHFHRGPLHDVPWRRLNPIVADLVARGLLQAHSKSPDEHYSLVSARKTEIMALIAASSEELDDDEDEEPEATRSAPATQVDLSPYATKEQLRIAVRDLRQEAQRASPAGVAQVDPERQTEVKRQIDGLDAQVRGLHSKITAFESRLDAMPKAPPKAAEPEKKAEVEKPKSEPKATQPRTSDAVLVSMTALMLGDIRHAPKVKAHADRLAACKGAPFAGFAWETGLHAPSACLFPACASAPAGVVPLLALEKDGPRLMQALACKDHVSSPRLSVAIGKGFQLARDKAEHAVHAAQHIQEDLELPLTQNMGPEMVTLIGFTDSDRKEWSFAGRQHWRKRAKMLPARVDSPAWAWGPTLGPATPKQVEESEEKLPSGS